MSFVVMKPLSDNPGKCPCCGHSNYHHHVLPLYNSIGRTFCTTTVNRGKDVFYQRTMRDWDDEEHMSLDALENIAMRSPDLDWRIHYRFEGGYELHYQRQDKGAWRLYEENQPKI